MIPEKEEREGGKLNEETSDENHSQIMDDGERERERERENGMRERERERKREW